ncbi:MULTISPECIES: long-chain-fatty-acid--CoA ligase [unclassified Tolypothrix]|nr:MULTISPECIES: long-chain-fatty-acid--CoA ligase [unclassified Tolypothrix]BAY91458.1 putative AMP-binding enzyme [Microchaete diplosiphon NIES-3275]EKF05499.1 CoA ligase [Tolypothrix sp. PCC 7601]MBE9085029.1 long-chain-fatty-acid--CoA ligase [Tolypothrix sp. LEGE 11397]UYD25493.1 long-chain-fatty-acid--CoA ligase [Tolypothrix sp. PCC 7712]UYD32267.1 long-chain-fatty-acid--CoA ligase [Tolypothrix sp. PCC 7601]
MNPEAVYRSILTPLTFIKRNAKVYSHKVAIIYKQNRFTYAEFAERINRLASALRHGGLEKGDRVAFFCFNTPPMLEAHFAVPLAGGVLVSINTRLAPQEVAYILNDCGAKFLFVDTELANVIRPIQDSLTTVKQIINISDIAEFEPLEGEDYEAFIQTGSNAELPWLIADEMETISINYTSGTSGKPKGVMYSHRGAYLNSLGEIIETTLTPNSVYLWTLPMFHCNGWCFTWAVTAIGGTHICLRKFHPSTVWNLIAQEKVTHFNAAPVVLISLLNHPNCPQVLAAPLTITTAGAPPSPTLIAKISEMGAKIIHVYGLTEVYGPYTVCEYQSNWEDLEIAEKAKLMARQGVPYIGADGLRVVDKNMHDVPADGRTMGEVVMQGNMVMTGYYNDPKTTERAFHGGWFHSGDLAVMHPDGYIEVRDRMKDIIITSGENVSSIEVEQCLYRHEAVLECAVISIPHPKRGEVPKAFVTLKEGMQVTEQELVQFCRSQIAGFKCPNAIEFTSLPKTSTGKIQKYLLREKAWVGHDKKIFGAEVDC